MFFIRDCNDQVVGNPSGYRTISAALSQQNNPRSKAYRAICEAFDAREARYDATCMPVPLRRRNLCSVRLATDIEN